MVFQTGNIYHRAHSLHIRTHAYVHNSIFRRMLLISYISGTVTALIRQSSSDAHFRNEFSPPDIGKNWPVITGMIKTLQHGECELCCVGAIQKHSVIIRGISMVQHLRAVHQERCEYRPLSTPRRERRKAKISRCCARCYMTRHRTVRCCGMYAVCCDLKSSSDAQHARQKTKIVKKNDDYIPNSVPGMFDLSLPVVW